jgi:photosystem II stability/assembly factor-like uncharacterized protein
MFERDAVDNPLGRGSHYPHRHLPRLILLMLTSLVVASCGIVEDRVTAVPCENAVENEWTYLGLEGESVTSIAIHPRQPNVIFAGTGFHFSDGRTGKLFRSDDCGVTWTMLLDGGAFHGIMFDPIDPGTIYAYAWPAVSTSGVSSRNLVRSSDHGNSWTGVLPEEKTRVANVVSLAIDPVDSRNMIVGLGAGWSGALIGSRDGGSSWDTIIRDGDPDDGDPTLQETITALLIHPANPQVILAGGHPSGTIYRSPDGGKTWDVTQMGSPNLHRFQAVDGRSGELYALSGRVRPVGGPLFHSQDWGQTWSSVSVIDTLHAYYDFFIDERDVLYLATNDGVLTDRTGEWDWLNEGFGSAIGPAIYTVRPDPTYTNMYAGMDYDDFSKPYRGGIYVRRLD